jgi:hypothetical protein
MYRSIIRAPEPDRKLTHAQGTPILASTAPGSFRVRFRTSEEPLSLLERPLLERAIGAEALAVDWACSSSWNHTLVGQPRATSSDGCRQAFRPPHWSLG